MTTTATPDTTPDITAAHTPGADITTDARPSRVTARPPRNSSHRSGPKVEPDARRTDHGSRRRKGRRRSRRARHARCVDAPSFETNPAYDASAATIRPLLVLTAADPARLRGAMARALGRPGPERPWARAGSRRTNRSKIRSRSPARTPGPLSSTCTWPPDHPTVLSPAHSRPTLTKHPRLVTIGRSTARRLASIRAPAPRHPWHIEWLTSRPFHGFSRSQR